MVQGGLVTPEIIQATRKADQEHEEKLKQMEIDLVKINADHEEATISSEV